VASGFSVAVVGATGAVGQEFIRLFEDRSFPIRELKLLASTRSAGKTQMWRGQQISIAEATPAAFDGVQVAFFSAGASRSKALVPAALEAGAVVIDNSSAFRMSPESELVVPEINGHLITPGQRLYSVPNCTAIILLMAVAPLRKLGNIDRLIVSTYQSASGGGAAMMQQLLDETRRSLDTNGLDFRAPDSKIPPYAFNLFSHNTPIQDNGFNEEEQKVIDESRRILEDPSLRVNVTCVRVPVLRAHSESITVEFEGDAPAVEEAWRVLGASPGVQVIDDRHANRFPTPLDASGQGDVLVGRIRRDPSNPNALILFACGDQLLKGAALNALQIAEAYIGLGQPAAVPATA